MRKYNFIKEESKNKKTIGYADVNWNETCACLVDAVQEKLNEKSPIADIFDFPGPSKSSMGLIRKYD